jgi:hypothetical protein
MIKDEHGRDRFKANAIVVHLLDKGGFDMNSLAMMDFSNEDREQFAQLIGYSLSGFGELSYVSEETYVAANMVVESGVDEQQVRNAYLRNLITDLRTSLRAPIANLYGIHPDDLGPYSYEEVPTKQG